MNILITNISAFPPSTRDVEDFEYEVRIDNCDVNKINAKHTNESILKCLSHLGDAKKNGGINKIIALVSQKTINEKDARFDNLTAFEYFKSIASTVFDTMPQIVEVKIETEEKKDRELYLVINEICSKISDDDIVYIDAAGGKRTTTNVIQLVTNILEYKGIENPLTLYSDIQNNPKFITDTKEFEQLTDLADAFNEFMTSGKSNLLEKCICLANSSRQYESLVTTMREFSDKIKLGKVDDLETTLIKLSEGIEQCKKNKGDNIESVIVNQFLPIIKQRFLGDSEANNVDYIKLVQWCLNNDLLQQALTIFTEKIPISIFEKKIVCYNGDVEKEKKRHAENRSNPLVPHDWETAIFYSEIMTTKVLDGNKALIQEFIDCLKSGQNTSDKRINDILGDVRCFKIKKVAKGKTAKILKDFCESKGIKSETSMINSICNNHQFVGQLLGLSQELKQNEDKIADKFAFVEALKKGEVERSDFSFGERCVDVMYGYLYVKMVRNTVNHASSEENLSDEQKKILSEYGYNFSAYDFQIVKSNVQRALDAISNTELVS